MKYDPPMMSKPFQAIINSSIFRRWRQDFLNHAQTKLKRRGNSIKDYIGYGRRKIRFSVYQKQKDPYYHMMHGARQLRMRWGRAFSWGVPEAHGPGPGLGMAGKELDYTNKITRMTEDDYTDTGISMYLFKMFPEMAQRKYFNELPRLMPHVYGLDYTKEQMFNHIAWGIDPGNEKLDELLYPTDPAKAEKRREELEIERYLVGDWAAHKEPGYQLKWPYPDDNVYRSTYERGSNRHYWSRELW